MSSTIAYVKTVSARGSCGNSDELPQVTQATAVESQNYKFENENKSWGVELQKSEATRSIPLLISARV